MMKTFIASILFIAFFTAPIFSQNQKCLSDEARELKKTELVQTAKRLKTEGKLPGRSTDFIPLEWPLRQADSFNDPGYYGIINYVDQDPGSGIRDYNCGVRTYDGHKGIDIMLWPYRWNKMDNDAVEIIAAAPGTIIGKDDGNFDKNCDCSTFAWNAVYVRHADGSVAWYGHMKENSLTAKAIGETVETGEYLGIVGSSGCSTDPHLHFEFYADSLLTMLVEPFAGDCNIYNGNTSWWADQLPYREPKINKLMTHFDAPEQNFGCPADVDVMNASNQFDPGDWVYFSANFQDQLYQDNTVFKIYKPDNSLWQFWNFESPDTYSASWWYWAFPLPPTANQGTWTFEATYYNEVYTHNFQVGQVVSTREIDNDWVTIFPNPFTDYFIVRLENIDHQSLQVELFGADRKKISSFDSGKILEIPAAHLPKGVYFLTIKENEQIKAIKKLVKL